jgi:TolA-binding protein
LHDQVIITAEYLNQLKIEDKPYGDYKFYYAIALAGVGRYDEALRVYDDIYATYPTRRDKAEALLHIGHIYRYDLKDYEAARMFYDSVAHYYLITPINLEAWYEIGLLHLVKADLDSAAKIFGQLVEEYRAIEDKERVEYQLAMIQFYRKDFEEANLAFRRLIAQYPHGYYVNDALINSLIISEAQLTFPDALADYTEAIYCRARLKPDSMATKFGQIIDQGLSTLVGLATYRLAEYRVETADTAAAMALIDNMENLYPDDYFYPYCLKMKGDIRKHQGDNEAASQIYRLILEKYNRYPFTGDVRTRLQEIEARIPTS